MSILSMIFLALAMSTDAFAAAIGKGAALHKPRIQEALRMGLIFGIIEALTPAIGWLLGRTAMEFVSEWGHWISFGLLVILGVLMIRAGFSKEDEAEEKPKKHSLLTLVTTAFATSIDAMAVGVGLAFAQVNILLASGLIGLATFTMVTIGVMTGRFIGSVVGKRAEALGGFVLILVGSGLLYQHFHGA